MGKFTKKSLFAKALAHDARAKASALSNPMRNGESSEYGMRRTMYKAHACQLILAKGGEGYTDKDFAAKNICYASNQQVMLNNASAAALRFANRLKYKALT